MSTPDGRAPDTRGPDTGLTRRIGDELRSLGAAARGAAWRTALATALAWLAFAVLLHAGGRWLTLPRAFPLAAWALAIVAALLTLRWRERRLAPPTDAAQLAALVETERGLRAGALRGALEVGSSGALGARALADVAARLPAHGTLAPARHAAVRRAGRGATAMLAVAVGALAIIAATARDGFTAVAHPLKAWRGMLLPALAFPDLPGDLPRGMPVVLDIDAVGRPTVTFAVRVGDAPWRDTVLVPDASGRARIALGPMRAPLALRLDDGRSPVVEATVAVGDRGWVGDLRARAVFPAYLARPAAELDLTAALRVPRGTRIEITARAYAGAHDVALVAGDDTVRFTTDGDALAATLTADAATTWTWQAVAAPRDGGAALPVELPDPLRVDVIPDGAPAVAITRPATDVEIGTSGGVGLWLEASDDHGVAEVALRIVRERSGDDATTPRRLVVAAPAMPVWADATDLSLDGFDLQPGDRLLVTAVARDDSPWAQLGTSAPLVLRVPSLTEQRERARALGDSLVRRAAALADAERQLARRTENTARSRDLQGDRRTGGESGGGSGANAARGDLSRDAAEKTRSLAREQREMGARVDSLRADAAALEERLREAGAVDSGLADRFRELQRMLQEAMTPEMLEQLRQVEQAGERLSGSEARQSLEQLAAQQKQLREQLEKSAEMLRRAALEGAMETLRDEAGELADAQRSAAEGARTGETPASEAREVAERTRRLDDDLAQLAERLRREGADAGAARTEAAKPDVAASREAMRRAAESLTEAAGRRAREERAAQREPSRDGQARDGQERDAPARADSAGARLGAGRPDSARSPKEEGLLARMLGQQQGDSAPPPPAGARRDSAAAPPRPTPQGGAQRAEAQDAAPARGGQAGRQGEQGEREEAGQGKPGTGGQRDGAAPRPADAARSGTPSPDAAAQADAAAERMERAAQQLADARDAQVNAWKQELGEALDQAINETAQLARQQQQLEQQMQQGNAEGMQGAQGAVQQGVQQAAARLEEASRGSALVSRRSQQAMAEAQRRVQQATQQLGESSRPGGTEQAQSAMRDAAQALSEAMSSLVRDRERVNTSGSASGFGDMLQQMRELAQQQGALNGQMSAMGSLPGGAQGQAAQRQARALARQQREVARGLQDVADADPTGRMEALAEEAAQVAQQLERQLDRGVDPAVAQRQQQLYRRLLDAGRLMEQDERDDEGPREASAGSGAGSGAPAGGAARGADARRFRAPTWEELRGLSAEDRRLVLEYFRRLNGGTP